MWAQIKGYEGLYYVSTEGEVYSVKSKKVLRPGKTPRGYLVVNLCKGGGKQKTTYVHRLVAETFILNPCDYPQVNHIDEVKTNNNVSNLEYCTASQNVRHGTGIARGAEKRRKKVNQYAPDGRLIRTWNSMTEASETLNIQVSAISYCCTGKNKTAGGYKWKHAKGDKSCSVQVI